MVEVSRRSLEMANILHALPLFDVSFLWHGTRGDDPSVPWDPSALERVSDIPGASFRTTACSTNPNGDLQVWAATQSGGVYHTIRQASLGTWSPWGDVIAGIWREHPSSPNPAPVGTIACSTNPNGDLQVCAATQSGGVYHTIRQASLGTWSPWGDVIAEILREHPSSPNPAPV